jgi:PilZ domain
MPITGLAILKVCQLIMSHHFERNADPRVRSRGKVEVAVDLRVPCGIRTKGYLIDLSETGFRIECMSVLTKAQPLFLTIPTFAQLEARVVWVLEYTYGCEFVRPLHPAIYDHVLAKHPAIGRKL